MVWGESATQHVNYERRQSGSSLARTVRLGACIAALSARKIRKAESAVVTLRCTSPTVLLVGM